MIFFSNFSFYISWIYLLLLFFGYLCAGWLLAAFQVPRSIWLGTLGVTIHLVFAEEAAIFLANVWVVTLISWAAIVGAKILVRDFYFQASLWAISLLSTWFLATILVFALAFASKITNFSFIYSKFYDSFFCYFFFDKQQEKLTDKTQLNSSFNYFLVIFTWIALWLGCLIYYLLF